MQIFDSHCHYNLPPFYPTWQQHWHRAQAEGVIGSIVVGTNIETSRRAVEIAQQDEHLWAAIGVHPYEYQKISDVDLPTTLAQHISALSLMLEQDLDNQIVAIGETGLDYYRLNTSEREVIRPKQQHAFRAHLELANKYKKILIIHARDRGGKKEKNNQAYWDILELVNQSYQHQKPFVLHCVSGPQKYISQAIDQGAYIGVAGNTTYPNATDLRNLISSVPAERILTETDAPYLPPQEFRGETCEPWMIIKTAEKLQEMGITPGVLL